MRGGLRIFHSYFKKLTIEITPLIAAGVFCAAILASVLLTEAARRYAVRNALLDVPNDRSLHSNPTPRGGGIAIAVVALVTIAVAGVAGIIQPRVAIGFFGGGVVVGVVGWWDDRWGVRPSVRILVHFAAACWLLYYIGGFASLNFGPYRPTLGWLGNVLAVLTIVWLINLYNFMDGADGLAASEASFVAVAGAAVLLWRGEVGLALIALAVGGAAAGFFFRNKSPAKIFLGDVGSGFLGFLFAALALASDKAGALPFVAWLILLGVFVIDATMTLIRRVFRGEQWYKAHRTHAYQRLVQSGWSHDKVTVCVLGLNVVLLCLVTIGVLRPQLLLVSVGAAIVILGAIYVRIEQLAPFPRRYRTLRN